jgi:hypothetical protein
VDLTCICVWYFSPSVSKNRQFPKYEPAIASFPELENPTAVIRSTSGSVAKQATLFSGMFQRRNLQSNEPLR